MLITSGTGFKKSFYKRLARDAAARGYLCLAFDCRGIGTSAPDDIAAMTDDYTAWGSHDMPAALDALASRLDGAPIVHAAHSVGGHFIGLWDNHEKIAAHAFMCVGSGYWGDHKFPNPLLELFFWSVYGRYSLWRHGYVKRGAGWMGEDLPPNVFKTWRRWCLNPTYFRDEIGASDGPMASAHYDAVTAPIRSWIYADDPIATVKTARPMLDLYPNAAREIVERAPADYGVAKIGHNGPFTENTAAARAEVLDWLDAEIAVG